MTPQQSIAHYRITGKLGEGGMGAVYRATDTKLNREVAIKILPAAVAGDADRLARFAREAQVLASLNHPNIAAVYGVEENAIVMELVEGEDLHGPVPVATALHYARQIALALEAAHEKGIVHRDLKPANIKITPEGVVKLLDFGLAKPTDEVASTASATISPTLSLGMTHAGVILGTAAYMSPEQARAKSVDRRADVWAFGVVLYEMLTGRMLFGGETLTDTIASVVKTEPDWTALPADTPVHIRWLLERCLRKDPRARVQAIADARMLMDDPPTAAARAVSTGRHWLPTIAAVLIVASVTAASMWWFRPKHAAAVTTRFTLALPPGTGIPIAGLAPQVVPSPDGRHLALVLRDDKTSKNYLWVRPLGSLSAQRFDKSEGANFPFWSPDGQFIGFFADHALKKVAVSGGAVQTIGETGTGNGDGATWNEAGTIVFAPSPEKGPLMKIAATGGPATPVTVLDTGRGEVLHSWPQFLPDGRHFLYFARNADSEQSGIYVQELGAPAATLLMKTSTRATFAASGHLLFGRNTTLFAQRMDAKTLQLRGDPVPLAEDARVNPDTGRSSFSASPNGVLAYRSIVGRNRQLTWYSREGSRLGTTGEPGEYLSMRMSPDERQVALMRRVAASLDTWVMDVASGTLTRVTFDIRQTQAGPVWSADSQRLLVNPEKGPPAEVVTASGLVKVLAADADIIVNDWSPDGQFLLCGNRAQTRVSILPLAPQGAGGPLTMQTLLDTPYHRQGFRLSPDGQWVAYTSNESGDFEVYVASFPSFAEKRRVSQGGGMWPLWRKDGKELLYPTLSGSLMAAAVKLGSKLEVDVPKLLFKISVIGFGQIAVAGDGKRFLVNEAIGSDEGQITVVLNWASELQ